MSKTLSLTSAMRKALETWRDQGRWTSTRMMDALFDAGLVGVEGPIIAVTPRGHAALAAPKMTQAEYELMSWMAKAFPKAECVRLAKADHRTAMRLAANGFIELDSEWYARRPNEAGLKALNDVRAAIGSAEWKP